MPSALCCFWWDSRHRVPAGVSLSSNLNLSLSCASAEEACSELNDGCVCSFFLTFSLFHSLSYSLFLSLGAGCGPLCGLRVWDSFIVALMSRRWCGRRGPRSAVPRSKLPRSLIPLPTLFKIPFLGRGQVHRGNASSSSSLSQQPFQPGHLPRTESCNAEAPPSLRGRSARTCGAAGCAHVSRATAPAASESQS